MTILRGVICPSVNATLGPAIIFYQRSARKWHNVQLLRNAIIIFSNLQSQILCNDHLVLNIKLCRKMPWPNFGKREAKNIPKYRGCDESTFFRLSFFNLRLLLKDVDILIHAHSRWWIEEYLLTFFQMPKQRILTYFVRGGTTDLLFDWFPFDKTSK